MRYEEGRQDEPATQSAPAMRRTTPPVKTAQNTLARSHLDGIMTDYQRDIARRMRLAMRGNNRTLARSLAARCACLGEWRKT